MFVHGRGRVNVAEAKGKERSVTEANRSRDSGFGEINNV